MEAQKYLGVANVALSSNIQQEQQQQAVRLQQKVSKLKVRLTTASAGPSVQLASKYCRRCCLATFMLPGNIHAALLTQHFQQEN